MLVQAAAGCAYSRVSPAALHHPAVLFRVRCGAIGSAIPLLLRSHSLYVVRFIMQYKIIDNILSSKNEHFLCRYTLILVKKRPKHAREMQITAKNEITCNVLVYYLAKSSRNVLCCRHMRVV